MLRYHEQVAGVLLRSDSCLAVLGRGLGVQRVVLELARRALADGGTDSRHAVRLVLLLNTPQEEAALLLRRTDEDAEWACYRDKFIVVGPEMSVEDRANAFAGGGVFVVSARLLVPDLLVGRLLPEAIDGIIVNHAHSVGELSADAFVVQIYRRKNLRGFVRAVSDRPEALARDQGQVEKVMQRCFLRQLEVWPRIRHEVQVCLQGPSQPEVCQKTLELPPLVHQIQRHVLNIIESTLDELSKDPTLDLGHLAVRDSLFRSFDSELRRALDPAWHRLGPRTRRMVHDTAGIRQLLSSLLRCDAVEFHSLLDSLRAAEGERDVAAWLLSPDAQALISLARARVYELTENHLRRTLEPHAKWQVLLDIIQRTTEEVIATEESSEEAQDIKPEAWASPRALDSRPAEATLPNMSTKGSADEGDDSGSDIEIVSVVPAKRARVAAEQPVAPVLKSGPPAKTCRTVLESRTLVIVPDEKVRRQILSVLHRGSEATLLDALGTYLKDRAGQGARQSQAPAAHVAAGNLRRAGSEAALLAREAQAVERALQELTPQSVLQMRPLPDGRACHPRVDVVATEGPEGTLEATLLEVQPHAVVMLEPSLEAVRALEVFCAEIAVRTAAPVVVKLEPEDAAAGQVTKDNGALRAAKPARAQTKAYLLVFEDSVEKFRFQQSLVRESEAVDSLIRARTSVTVRIDDGVGAPATNGGGAEMPRSSRRGGGSRTLDALVQQKVVVDMREFRSALPFMLYLRGLTIDPVTIPVGDYVLSRDICVERKAIPDLVQSLASGRLHQQAQNMCHHYANPSLLIEFDPGKSFALQNCHSVARREVDVGARDLLGKLALIVLHFPKLRLVWSPSQRFSADLFLRLKEGRYQPDPQAAAQIDAADWGAEEPLAGSGVERSQRLARANSAAFDVLRKLPGVTPKNMYALARRAGSLAGIALMPEEELVDIVGRVSARQLREFLDKETPLRNLLGEHAKQPAPEENQTAPEEIAQCALEADAIVADLD